MLIDDPFQSNDWGIKRFLLIVLSLQLAFWGVLGLDLIGIHIPLLRPVISLIYLLYIPGILLLRVLKLHKLGTIETLLYSVGLSIAVLMFTGLAMNTVYPSLGIPRPISVEPLVITISALVLILCVVSYFRDRDFSEPHQLNAGELLSPPALFLYLLPLISILGTKLVDEYQNTIVLMALMIIIAIVAILVGFRKLFPEKLYPLAVFSIGLSLLLHRSMISMYITGFDIHYEYYLANQVITGGIWDPIIPVQYNTMLSVTMLGPIDSILSGLSLTWVFKIIYPLLFTLVPLGLYRVFQKQTNEPIAFLGCFFFILIPQFYVDLPTIMRQQIGSIFLVALVMLMVDKHLPKNRLGILLLVFGASLVVSHYGLAYVFIFCIIPAWLILALAENKTVRKISSNLHSKIIPRAQTRPDTILQPAMPADNRVINSAFILFFIAFTFVWYVYISGSGIFHSLVGLVDYIINGIFTGLLNPETSEGLRILTQQAHVIPLFVISRIMTYIIQFLIVIGVLSIFVKPGETKFEKEYAVVCILNLMLLFATIVVPYFTAVVNVQRLYHITLIVLAPFPIIGAATVFRVIGRKIKVPRIRWTKVSTVSALSVFFAVYFLYQSGFVAELAGQNWFSVALNRVSMESRGTDLDKVTLYTSTTFEQDVASAQWLSSKMLSGSNIYATFSDIIVHPLLSYGGIPREEVKQLTRNMTAVPADAYVYLQHLNVVNHIATEYSITRLSSVEKHPYDMAVFSDILDRKNEVYSNGGSQVYR